MSAVWEGCAVLGAPPEAVAAWHVPLWRTGPWSEAGRPGALQVLGAPPGTPVFLDLETTGLGGAGSVPFLAGLATVSPHGHLWVRQYLLLDYPAEPLLLSLLRQNLTGRVLVTYNGAAFDWPLLRDRWAMHGEGVPALAGHLDALPLARRALSWRLPRLRLADVEAVVLGPRGPDLPGREVPARFHQFLADGQAEALLPVLLHNLRDLAALAALTGHLARAVATPSRPLPAAYHAALARVAEKAGRRDLALAHLEAARAQGGPSRSLGRELARLLQQEGRHEDAARVYQETLAAARLPWSEGWLGLARALRRMRAPSHTVAAALSQARRALAEEQRLGLPVPPRVTAALQPRHPHRQEKSS